MKSQNHPTQTLMIYVLTPVFKMNDTAFLKKQNHALTLQVYKFGQAFFELKIKDKICYNFVCYDKKVFNQKFFNNEYYEDILRDILSANVLWQGRNLERTNCGFKQKLKTKDYAISYELCDDELSFVDESSGVKIILRYI